MNKVVFKNNGLSRRDFIIATILIAIVEFSFGYDATTVINGLFELSQGVELADGFLYAVISMLLSLVLSFYRLRDIGYRGWFCLLAFVPFVNLFLFALCFCVPSGYKATSKLDTVGKVLIAGFIFFWLAIVSISIYAYNLAGQAHESGKVLSHENM